MSVNEGAKGSTVSALQSDNRCIVLPQLCIQREIGALHDCLRSTVPELRLDGSNVERIDSAGLRLLAAFFHEQRACGRRAPVWLGVSAALMKAVAAVGLSSACHLPLR